MPWARPFRRDGHARVSGPSSEQSRPQGPATCDRYVSGYGLRFSILGGLVGADKQPETHTHNEKGLSRNNRDFSRRFPNVARSLEALPVDTVLDREIVAVNRDGQLSVSSL